MGWNTKIKNLSLNGESGATKLWIRYALYLPHMGSGKVRFSTFKVKVRLVAFENEMSRLGSSGQTVQVARLEDLFMCMSESACLQVRIEREGYTRYPITKSHLE